MQCTVFPRKNGETGKLFSSSSALTSPICLIGAALYEKGDKREQSRPFEAGRQKGNSQSVQLEFPQRDEEVSEIRLKCRRQSKKVNNVARSAIVAPASLTLHCRYFCFLQLQFLLLSSVNPGLPQQVHAIGTGEINQLGFYGPFG